MLTAFRSQAFLSAILIVCVVSLTSCVTTDNESEVVASDTESVWALDLIETFPGQQENYVKSIEENWAGARALAIQRGIVLSFQAFVADQDSTRGWDVILMTEYADSSAFANREESFQEIFESDEFVRYQNPVPSSEMRQFFVGEVTLNRFVNE